MSVHSIFNTVFHRVSIGLKLFETVPTLKSNNSFIFISLERLVLRLDYRMRSIEPKHTSQQNLVEPE